MASRPLLPGSQLGGYRIVELLGRGGMGAVYKAEDGRGGLVAIKVVLPELAQDERLLARFRREASAARAVSHPNVVAIQDVGEERGVPFVVLELAPGGSLKQRIRQRGALPWKEVAALGAQVARGLAAIHAAGLVHRDLKPENVLLSGSGAGAVAKVSDFGLVGRDAAFSKGSLTRTGELLGTLEYMAPEQADDAARVDARADLYSLGATLYALLTGEPPFSGTGYELVTKHLRSRARPPSELVPAIPQPLEALVLSLLAKDPAARARNASAVAEELEAIARPGGAGRRGRSRVILGASLSLAVLVAGGVALVSFLGSPEQREESPPPVAGPGPKLPKEPPPPPPPPPRPPEAVFPAICSGFLRSARGTASLAMVFGRYGGKVRSMIHAAVFSPDGKLVLTASNDPALVLWDLEQGLEIRRLVGHKDGVLDAAFSRDGKLVFSCSKDRTIRSWEVATGRERRSIDRDALRAAHSLAVAPDGKRIATANRDGKIAFFDAETLEELNSLPGHEGGVLSIAFDASGSRLLSGGSDRAIRLWDLETGKEILKLEAHQETVTSVALSRDGRRALSMGGRSEATVRLWDLGSGRSTASFSSPNSQGGHDHPGYHQVAISPDGTRGLLGQGGHARVLDLESGQERTPLDVSSHWSTDVTAVGFSPDGTRVTTGECCGQARLWETATGREIGAAARGSVQNVTSVALTRDGKRALSAASDGAFRVWDVASGKEVAREDGEASDMNALALSSDDRRVVTVHHPGVEGWDLASGKRLWKVRGHQNNVLAVAVLPGDRRVLSAADDGLVKGWNVETGEQVSELDAGKLVWLFALAVAPDGKKAAVGGREPDVLVFDPVAGTEIATLHGHTASVQGLAFLPDGKRLLSASNDKTVKLWDLATGAAVRTFAHGDGVVRVAALPDGERALSASDDGTVRVWELATGKELDRIDLASSSDWPYGIAVAADGRSFVVGTRRGVLLRFELEAARKR